MHILHWHFIYGYDTIRWQWAQAARSLRTWNSVTWLCTPQQQCFCITFMNFKNWITIFRATKRTKRSQCIASFYHSLMMAKTTEMLGNDMCWHIYDMPCSLFNVTSKQMDWERLDTQTNGLGKTRSNSLLWTELSFAQYSLRLSTEAFERYKLYWSQVVHMVSWHSCVHDGNGAYRMWRATTEHDPKHPRAQCTIMSTHENSWSSITVFSRNPTSQHVWWSNLPGSVGYQKEKSGYLQCSG